MDWLTGHTGHTGHTARALTHWSRIELGSGRPWTIDNIVICAPEYPLMQKEAVPLAYSTAGALRTGVAVPILRCVFVYPQS